MIDKKLLKEFGKTILFPSVFLIGTIIGIKIGIDSVTCKDFPRCAGEGSFDLLYLQDALCKYNKNAEKCVLDRSMVFRLLGGNYYLLEMVANRTESFNNTDMEWFKLHTGSSTLGGVEG